MVAELATLTAAADKPIQSNPLLPETWDLDLSACLPIAQAHLHRWSADVGDLSVALCEHGLTHTVSLETAQTVAPAVKEEWKFGSPISGPGALLSWTQSSRPWPSEI
jgi:hypothetical protein